MISPGNILFCFANLLIISVLNLSTYIDTILPPILDISTYPKSVFILMVSFKLSEETLWLPNNKLKVDDT